MPTIDNWRALREALDAGPTEGERFIQDASPWTDAEGKFVQFEAFNISAGSADRSSEDYYRIASVSNINDAPCNKANAMLFAAAHPAAIRSLLDERDRLETSVEVLIVACKLVIEMNQDTARDKYGDPNKCESWACVRTLRAAIDAAMKGKP